MKKSNVLKGLGVTALTLGLFFNLQYALIDYGMHNNSLGTQLTAQTNSNGGSSGGDGSGGEGTGTSGGGLLWKKAYTNTDCTYRKTTTYWVKGGIIYYGWVAGAGETTSELEFTGKMTRCDDGWNFCLSGCEGAGTST